MLQACLDGYTIKPAFYEVGGVKKEHFKSTDVIAFDVDDAFVAIVFTLLQFGGLNPEVMAEIT